MSLEALYADSIEQGLQRWAANPGPEAPPSFNITSFLAAGAKGLPSAALESGGSVADVLSGFGTALAASGGSAGGMFSLPTPAEQKQEAQARDRMLKGEAFDVSAGNAMREQAQAFAPDPLTTHQADQVMHGLVRFGAKAVADVGTMGPAGAILLGLDEGNTVTQNLRTEGLDTETAAKVGAVQGGISAASAVIPLGGRTIAQTIGLVGIGGPGSYMAQEHLSRRILEEAGYNDQASLHNPFDPLGLALSTIIPGGFGALHVRGEIRRAEGVKAGTVPLQQLRPEELRSLKYDDPRLDAYASQAAEANGVPPALLLAIKNAGEKSGPTAVSGKGATGVMQFMEGTAKEMGLADRTDPVASIDAAARYMRKLYDAYGSWDAAVAHYNGGGAQAAIVRGGGKPTAKETIGYLDRVQQYVAQHTAQEAAQHPQAVDAARVAALNDTVQRSLPDTPDAMAQVQRAADILGESSGRDAEQMIPPAIPRSELPLSASDQVLEDSFARKLADNMDAAIREYASRPDSMGGKVLNTDVARELSPDYLSDRTRSAAVHEPASWFIKQLYERKLAELQPGDRVVFTSGGTGAGKTTAIENVPAIKRLQSEAALVYDTNMNTLGSAVKKIDKALAAGAEVQILHVQRDPVDALVHGALPRAMRQEREFGSGRTVPIAEHARTHQGSAEVIQQLAAKYADNPNVVINVLDNTHGKGRTALADLAFIRDFPYNDVEGKLHEALRQEYQAGRISEAVYRATESQGVGPEAGRGNGGRPESGNVRADDSAGNSLPDASTVKLEGDEPAKSGSEGEPFQITQPKPQPAGEGSTPSLDQQMAARLAAEKPEMAVVLPGSEERISVAEAMKRIADEQKQDLQWGELVRVAAECSLMAA